MKIEALTGSACWVECARIWLLHLMTCLQPLSPIHCQLVAFLVMDHGGLLRECRHLLHAILSQISILLAGLQRIEGHQRHPGHRHQHRRRHHQRGHRSLRRPSRLWPLPRIWRTGIPLSPLVTVHPGNATGGEGHEGEKCVGVDLGAEVATGDRLTVATEHRGAPSKASPAALAMPACRPSGLPRGR